MLQGCPACGTAVRATGRSSTFRPCVETCSSSATTRSRRWRRRSATWYETASSRRSTSRTDRSVASLSITGRRPARTWRPRSFRRVTNATARESAFRGRSGRARRASAGHHRRPPRTRRRACPRGSPPRSEHRWPSPHAVDHPDGVADDRPVREIERHRGHPLACRVDKVPRRRVVRIATALQQGHAFARLEIQEHDRRILRPRCRDGEEHRASTRERRRQHVPELSPRGTGGVSPRRGRATIPSTVGSCSPVPVPSVGRGHVQPLLMTGH